MFDSYQNMRDGYDADITAEKQQKRVVGKPFKKGESGNPTGRPRGSFSIKEQVRQYLENNPKENEAFVLHFVKKNRELAWQMLESKPKAEVGLNLEANKESLETLTAFFKEMASPK